MNDDSILGNALGQLGQTVKQATKQIVKLPEEMAKDVGRQVGSAKSGTVQNPTEQNADASKILENKQGWQSDEERVKFLRDLYGSSEKNFQPSPEATAGKANLQMDKDGSQSPQNKKPTEFEEQIADKSAEEQKKLVELRNQLHKENYYDPTFNPENPPAEEERASEKVENEKKKEMQDLQKKEEKKPPPLAVVREQNKTEMFRGAAG